MNSERVIRRWRDFRRLYSRGRKLQVDGLTLYVAAREDRALPARLGLAVTAPPNAVVRNRVKRRLRAAFSHCHATGVDVVVRGGREVASLPFQVLVERLCWGVRKALGAEA